MFYVIEMIGYTPDRPSGEWIAFKSESAYVTNEIEKATKFYDKKSARGVLQFVAAKYKTRGMIIEQKEGEK